MTTTQNIRVCFRTFYKTLFSHGSPLWIHLKFSLSKEGTLKNNFFIKAPETHPNILRCGHRNPYQFKNAIKSGGTVFLLISLGLNSLPGSCGLTALSYVYIVSSAYWTWYLKNSFSFFCRWRRWAEAGGKPLSSRMARKKAIEEKKEGPSSLFILSEGNIIRRLFCFLVEWPPFE